MLDRIASRLEQYMDLLSTRQKLVASNIANSDTPGYKRSGMFPCRYSFSCRFYPYQFDLCVS